MWKCAVLLIHAWSDLTFFLLLSRSLEKLYKALYIECLCWRVLFLANQDLIFKECFSFLNFCMSEIIHCMFFPAPLHQTVSRVVHTGYLIHWLPAVASSIILAKTTTKKLPPLYIMSHCSHSLLSLDAINVYLQVLLLDGPWDSKEIFFVL